MYSNLAALPREARRRAGLARSFKKDEQLEHLIAHPEQIERLPISTRASLNMQIGYYRIARDAAIAEGLA